MITDLWNLWDVTAPPVCCVKTDLHFKGISDLHEVTFNALKTLRDFNHFDREAAVLSRFLYRYKRIFRHDKGIQNLVKINQCLKKYLKLDMSGILFAFKHALPHNLKQTSTIAYLPTKQMLKWILLRLQAFAQLFVRVTELSKETGAYVYKKMCLGWSLNLSFLVFSMTARILTTSKFLVAKCIEWYTSFHKCLPYLQETADFLPDHDFPADLKLWLGNVDVLPLKKKTFADEIFELIDLAEEDEEKEEEKEEDLDGEVKIVNEKFIKSLSKANVTEIDSDIEEIMPEEVKLEKKGVKRPKTFQEDLGVPVDDDDNDDETERVAEVRGKRFKKKEGKRVKWLKKVKKTLNRFEKSGMPESSLCKRRSGGDHKASSYLTID